MRTITRLTVGLVAALVVGCGGDHCGVPDVSDLSVCSGTAVEQCERQCGGGPSQNICYPDPIYDSSTSCYRCFCTPCQPIADLGAHD